MYDMRVLLKTRVRLIAHFFPRTYPPPSPPLPPHPITPSTTRSRTPTAPNVKTLNVKWMFYLFIFYTVVPLSINLAADAYGTPL